MLNCGALMGPPQLVRVKREILAACLTCPLCSKLLRDATTISECLHTFCRKCIFDKLSDEEADCCPICNIYLGRVRLEKLRPDHNLQDVITKIFPTKRRKVHASEVSPPVTLPVRRKERSLSSLVVNTPRIGTQVSLTGRRTKAIARRASTFRGLSPISGEPIKKDGDNCEHLSENSSSPESLSKISLSRRQSSSNVEANSSTPSNGSLNGRERSVEKSELWKPLNCLVEAANRTKGVKANPHDSIIKVEQSNGLSDVRVHKAKVRDHLIKSKYQEDENNGVPTSPVGVKARKMQSLIRKRKEVGPSVQAMVDATDAARERRLSAIWLSLVSSSDEKGDKPLPQISSSYLRIKEGNLPVTFVQKYLVKKLNLTSEAEVEIACRGQPVNPTLSLYDLTEQWLRQGPSERVKASVGHSAKEFVMVLTYTKKPPSL
ncbi:hypothetical protein HPP92_016925 [Vanilla planifolia]|uniref:RING-type domain-containing protein n=1 Tax=Vanilla planifolia TaxID=51239 RepID=A0A835QJM0_VANPL|nr:hypothetical protein HPP92_017519 [Vanilla planifolia]KAG0472379.1 hypothetical protein HPP92_016925 [Vanilla planifolia]